MTARAAPLICGAAVGLVAMGFYLATLAPGLTWAHDSADGGEFAAAAHTLGIPHPPGYPTYVLLAHVFTLLPVGEVATRTNLFSAACAAGTVGLLTWAVARATNSWAAAAGAGFGLAFSPLLWFQAVVTEVHALNAFFAALLLALTTQATHGPGRPSRRNPPLALAVGGAWGLSLGNHLTALFCGSLVLLALWRLRRSWIWGIAGVALGLLVYLYLPLRAAAEPQLNWGNPQTAERVWWMLTGGPYRQFFFSLPQAYLPQRLLSWASLLTRQFGWVGLVVMALGGAVLWSTDHALFWATAATVALCSAFAIGYDTADSYLYLIPPLVCLGLWLGMGLAWLIGRLATRVSWWAAWAAMGVAIALPLAAGVLRLPVADLGDERAAYDFQATVLTPAPPSAIILSRSDASTFGLWYFQYARGLRPDVVVVDPELLGYDWYVAQLSQQLATPLPVDPLRAAEPERLRHTAQALGRPVCWMEPGDLRLSCVEP